MSDLTFYGMPKHMFFRTLMRTVTVVDMTLQILCDLFDTSRCFIDAEALPLFYAPVQCKLLLILAFVT